MQNTHTKDHILTVRLNKMEPLLPSGFELFPELRNTYLFDPKSGSGKINRTGEADGKRYSAVAKYQFASRNPSWKLTVNGNLWQRSVCQNGQMVISTPDTGRGVRKEEAYRIENGEWFSVQYFRNGQRAAEAVWNPEDQSVLIQYYDAATGHKSTAEKLVPCPELDAANAELCAEVFAAAGEPVAAVLFQSGTTFYYLYHRLSFVQKEIRARLEGSVPEEPSAQVEPEIPSADEALVAALAAEPSAEQLRVDVTDEEVPQMHELWKELAPEESEASQAEEKAAEPVRLCFAGENGENCIEHDAQGNLLYAGGMRAGERNGFGISREGAAVFAGTWLYGGRHGLLVQPLPENAYQVQIENAMQESPDAVQFGADGKLQFAGEMADGKRNGFGFAQVIPSKTWYIGTWKDDLPDGNGMYLAPNGEVLYSGGFCAGKREGSGAEFAHGVEKYRGEWKNDRYHGEGVLHTDDQMVISGRFADGKPQGIVRECTVDGTLIYAGEMVGGRFEGNGTLYLPNGETLSGQFAAGTPVNAEHRNAEGVLLYRGGFAGLHYSGRGTRFENGTAVYEGNFVDGVYSGNGKLLNADGETLYAGSFVAGMRSGIGAEFERAVPRYFGQWKDDCPNGCGICYAHGKPYLAGCFADGKPHGRVNQYRANGMLEKELLCEQGQTVYMVEYNEAGAPVYAGAVYKGMRSGMGRSLNEFGECESQGIFSNGSLMKAGQVMLRTMDALPCPEELQDTEYAALAVNEERFVLDLPYSGRMYSGWVRNGIPNGKGSLLAAGHCYTGEFVKGEPAGEGKLYLATGETVSGIFGKQDGAEELTADGTVYFVIRREEPEREPVEE